MYLINTNKVRLLIKLVNCLISMLMVLLSHNWIVNYYEARFDFYPKDFSVGIGLEYAFLTYVFIMMVCCMIDSLLNKPNVKWIYLIGLLIFFAAWCFAFGYRPLRFLNLYLLTFFGAVYLMFSNYLINALFVKYSSNKITDNKKAPN